MFALPPPFMSGTGGSSGPTGVFVLGLSGIDTTTGATFTDTSASHVTITNTGSVNRTSNKAVFVGSQNLRCLNDAVFNTGANDFEYRVGFTTTQGLINATIISRGSNTFSSGSFALQINTATNDGKLRIYYAEFSTSTPFLTSSAAFNDGTRHEVIWSRVGTAYTLKVDGSTVDSNTHTGDPANLSSTSFFIGDDRVFTPRSFVGIIDEVALIV